MSSILKTQDLVRNSSNDEEFRKALSAFKIDDLEVLLDWYMLYEDDLFKSQIEALKEEIYLRNTKLGKELF